MSQSFCSVSQSVSQSVSGPSNVYVNFSSPLCWISPASRELQVLLEKGPGLYFKQYLQNILLNKTMLQSELMKYVKILIALLHHCDPKN